MQCGVSNLALALKDVWSFYCILRSKSWRELGSEQALCANEIWTSVVTKVLATKLTWWFTKLILSCFQCFSTLLLANNCSYTVENCSRAVLTLFETIWCCCWRIPYGFKRIDCGLWPHAKTATKRFANVSFYLLLQAALHWLTSVEFFCSCTLSDGGVVVDNGDC